MRFNSLESRVVILFITLILTVQMVGFFVIQDAINSNGRAAINAELKIGERIFGRLLDQNAQKLIQGANVLAKDFAFLVAIGSQDVETIKSALINHGDRIGASLSMLIGVDRKIRASTSAALATDFFQGSVLPLLMQAEQSGSASSTAIVDGRPYQLVLIPVKAPVTIGWVLMAIPIDRSIVADMHELSAFEVSIFTNTENGKWQTDVSSLPTGQARRLAHVLPIDIENRRAGFDFKIDDEEYIGQLLPLAKNDQYRTIAVLQLSVSEAVAPYKKLQFRLLILTVLGVVVAIVLSILTARRITGPVRQLLDTAKRLGAGDYRAPIEVKRNDEIGDLAKTFISMRDGIAHREQEIRKLAYWDPLTHLPNRALFLSMLKDALSDASKHQQSCFVLIMDLNRFKHVNDIMGHSFGDLMLIQVAKRLTQELGLGGTKPARLGGDEFAILLTNADLAAAHHLAARILRSLETPISIEQQTVDLGAGIGIAGCPEHASNAETLLSHAEVAMYAAKRSNSGAVSYTPEIDGSSQLRLSLLSEMRTALEQQAFRLYVQPKIALGTGQVIAVEALIRWLHPERGFIYPDHFIPFAEQTGFIRQLSLWVLNEAAGICGLWSAQGVHLKMSINLSTLDLLDQELPEKFSQVLHRHGITPTVFCLEITESAIMDDPVRAQQTLEKLHSMGFDLSIDDFGTGYSSLAYLKKLPVDELKIDKSFVLNMEQDADDSKIVKSTIDLGHNMGLRVVAEGVENLAVMQLLKEMGCDQAQGYYISKAMPAAELPAWLSSWVPATHQA
ncbi:putative bifunctional diguanylate cyclase/phosphodiesterase [Undibacterium sp. Ren11W]|uniref:putative bifunctional diguanylate cyclase/phosphodiesterase n=1 Tax=Undibacterium sp. Ren11W TaxID=3413045 RepID=UPI003BF43A5B